MVLFFNGLTSRFIVSGSAIFRWFVELSYPIYIIHIIPIAMMSALFYRAGLSQPVIFVLKIIAGFIVCVILYYILIKFIPLNWLINGYSKSPIKIKVWGRQTFKNCLYATCNHSISGPQTLELVLHSGISCDEASKVILRCGVFWFSHWSC